MATELIFTMVLSSLISSRTVPFNPAKSPPEIVISLLVPEAAPTLVTFAVEPLILKSVESIPETDSEKLTRKIKESALVSEEEGVSRLIELTSGAFRILNCKVSSSVPELPSSVCI